MLCSLNFSIRSVRKVCSHKNLSSSKGTKNKQSILSSFYMYSSIHSPHIYILKSNNSIQNIYWAMMSQRTSGQGKNPLDEIYVNTFTPKSTFYFLTKITDV